MRRLCKISVPSMSQTLSLSPPAVEGPYRSRQVDGDVEMSRLGVPERVDLDLGAASSHGVYASYVRERAVSEHRCTAERGIAASKEP